MKTIRADTWIQKCSNIQESVVFLYTNSERSERACNLTIPFKIVIKKILNPDKGSERLICWELQNTDKGN